MGHGAFRGICLPSSQYRMNVWWSVVPEDGVRFTSPWWIQHFTGTRGNRLKYRWIIRQYRKSHDSPAPYPTIYHSEQKWGCLCSEWCVVWYGAGALWDLWDWSITEYPMKYAHSFVALCLLWLYDQLCANGSIGLISSGLWTSYQIRKTSGAHAPEMSETFSPSPRVSDPAMHHGTCVTSVPWCMPGSLTSGFLWSRRREKTFLAFPAHAQSTLWRIW